MAEEMLGGLDVGNVSNTLGEASEQDMIRVSESMQKAAQMGGQIRDDQKKNTHIAQFLTFLFGAIQDEEIRSMCVELFSQPDSSNLNQTLAVSEMVALFLPFYASKAQEVGVDLSFPTLHYAISLSEENYVGYVRQLFSLYPLYQTLDRGTLTLLIAALLWYHQIISLEEGQSLQDVALRIRSLLP